MIKKKGVFLIYVLFTAVLITVFLLTAVKDMQDSFFLTKRFSGDNKAYWASLAGIEYCEYKIKEDVSWPFLNTESSSEPELFGSFKVELKKHGDDGYYIHGVSEKEKEEFHIYFSNKNSNEISDEAKKLNGSDKEISIVPDTFPSDDVKDLSYCSYNSMTQAKTLIFDDSKSQEEGSEDYASINLIVSKNNNHKAKITFPGIYIVSDGRSGGYKSVIEKMFIVDNNNICPAGIYAGGEIDIQLLGNNSTFKISQTSNLKPEIYCKKDMKIEKRGVNSADTEKYTIPMSARAKGTIYFGAKNNFTLTDDLEKNNDFSTNGNFEKYVNFKKQFGINLDTYTDSKDNLFPKLSWNNIESIANNIQFQSIPSGSYVAIYENLSDLNGKLKTDFKKRYPPNYQGYILIRLPNAYLDESGEFKEKEFKSDLEAAKLNQTALSEATGTGHSKIAEANTHIETHTETHTDEEGNSYTETHEVKVYDPEGDDIEAIKKSDRGLIIELLKKIHGKPDGSLKDDYENCNDYIISSNKPEIENCGGEAKDVFSIKTVKLNNVHDTVD